MRKSTIVIIDDDAVDVKDIKRKIAKISEVPVSKKFNIEIFNTSEAGLEWLLSNDADLLILDICLPGLDGTQVLKLLNKHDVTVPTCLISGVNDMLYIAQEVGNAHDSIIVAQFKKPIPIEELGKLLKDLAIV